MLSGTYGNTCVNTYVNTYGSTYVNTYVNTYKFHLLPHRLDGLEDEHAKQRGYHMLAAGCTQTTVYFSIIDAKEGEKRGHPLKWRIVKWLEKSVQSTIHGVFVNDRVLYTRSADRLCLPMPCNHL
jgi:hypothetical protein